MQKMANDKNNPGSGDGAVPAGSDPSLTDRLEEYRSYMQNGGFSQQTISSYAGCVSRYIKWFRDSYGGEPKNLFRENILDFKSYLNNIRKLSPETINLYICALVSFNEYLVTIGSQTEMAVRGKDRVKIQASQTNPNDLESADVDSFRQKILEGQGKRDHAIVTVMAYAGLRISEVISLYVQDIVFDAGEILVRNGKGEKARTVYLNDKISNAVREYLKERSSDSPYLFVSRQGGGKLSRSRVNQIFNQYSDLITPHKLRHFFCSQSQNVAGYSITETAQQAGHASTKTTLRYSHPDRKAMIEKSNKL